MAARVYRHRHPGSMIPLAFQEFRAESRQRQSAIVPAAGADNPSLKSGVRVRHAMCNSWLIRAAPIGSPRKDLHALDALTVH